MPAEDRAEWATKTVALTPEVKARLEQRRSYPKEPLWSVVARLLDAGESQPRSPQAEGASA